MKTLLQKTAINLLFLLLIANSLSAQSVADENIVYVVIDFEDLSKNISDLSKTKYVKNSALEFSILKNNDDKIVFNCSDKFRILNLNEKDLKKLNPFQISRIADMDIVTFLKELADKKFFILEKLESNKYKLYSGEKHAYIEKEQ